MPRGGFRAGSGRPTKTGEPKREAVPKPETVAKEGLGISPGPASNEIPEDQPSSLVFLDNMVRDVHLDVKMRFEAAKALLPFQTPKTAAKGKKDAQKEKAEKTASKFTQIQPPGGK